MVKEKKWTWGKLGDDEALALIMAVLLAGPILLLPGAILRESAEQSLESSHW